MKVNTDSYMVQMMKYGEESGKEIPCGEKFFTCERETANRVAAACVMGGSCEKAYIYKFLDLDTKEWELQTFLDRVKLSGGSTCHIREFHKQNDGEWHPAIIAYEIFAKPVCSPVWYYTG